MCYNIQDILKNGRLNQCDFCESKDYSTRNTMETDSKSYLRVKKTQGISLPCTKEIGQIENISRVWIRTENFASYHGDGI
jgi:hypothetical protein